MAWAENLLQIYIFYNLLFSTGHVLKPYNMSVLHTFRLEDFFLFVSGKIVYEIPSFTIDGVENMFSIIESLFVGTFLALHAFLSNQLWSNILFLYP